MLAEPASPVTSLYIHVPFCARKCRYCAFYSAPGSEEIIQRYVAALVRELEIVSADLTPRTIFFGGGTPSLLSLRQWETIFAAMERLKLLGAEEWTIECNPATVSLEQARLWRSYGVNRVSMGVQSFARELLERLGRIHTPEMAFESFDLLRKSGFENINLDLMFAIPGQSLAAWQKTLVEAAAMQSEHLSCYEIIYEEDTEFFKDLQEGVWQQDEELACAMYEDLLERAAEEGFEQYEVANFARKNGEAVGKSEVPRLVCRHNVNYWRGGRYYGLGPSAASYVGGIRTKNWPNTELYCRELEKGVRAIESEEKLPPLRRAGETAAFGLRMNAGWPLEDFRKITGYDLCEEWKTEIEQLVARGWGEMEQGRFHLTRQGMRFADAAAELFLR